MRAQERANYNTAGWLLLNTGIASTIAGASLLGVALMRDAELNDVVTQEDIGGLQTQEDIQRLQGQRDEVMLYSYITFGVAGAALLAGLLTWTLMPDEVDAYGGGSWSLNARPMLATPGATFSLRGRF